jgi:hypothetical protein
MAKELKDMGKPELLAHIQKLEKTIAESSDATALTEAKETIAKQEETIAELMGTVAKLDAEPKAKVQTIKIGKVEHMLTVPKSYIRVAAGEPTALCTLETCASDEAIQAAALSIGLLIPVEK